VEIIIIMPEQVIWKEFPEINRKVAFKYSYRSEVGTLGCHCGSISGVTASFGTLYYAANNGRNVEVLDTTKEPQFRFQGSGGYGTAAPPEKELTKVRDYLRNSNVTFNDLSELAYPQIVQNCSALPLWLMSDVINYEAPARKVQPTSANIIYEVFGHTSDFAKYLIDNKIGYMMASPIVQNPSHRSSINYSLNQGWIWIPPNHLNRAVNVGKTYGSRKFPNKETWIKTIGTDIGKENEEDILKAVFNDGVFPPDKRFKRKQIVVEA
jgi:hypothetical protein